MRTRDSSRSNKPVAQFLFLTVDQRPSSLLQFREAYHPACGASGNFQTQKALWPESIEHPIVSA